MVNVFSRKKVLKLSSCALDPIYRIIMTLQALRLSSKAVVALIATRLAKEKYMSRKRMVGEAVSGEVDERGVLDHVREQVQCWCSNGGEGVTLLDPLERREAAARIDGERHFFWMERDLKTKLNVESTPINEWLDTTGTRSHSS
jgi:hypothetical protein